MLQALHGLSDGETVDAVTFDLRWKAACGLPVTAAAFHPTTLTYWRRRLAAQRAGRTGSSTRSRRWSSQTGVLTGKTRRALDSTVLDDAVATQDTVTQLIAAVRRVRREVPGAAAVVAEHCTAHDYDDPGKPTIAWNDEQARAELVDALVGDAHRLLGHLPEQELGPKAGRGGGAAGAGRRAGRRTGRGLRRHRRAVAHRPAGRAGPGHLHRRPGRPARAQDRAPPPGRVQGPPRGRTGHRDHHRLRADQGRRRRTAHEAVVGLDLLDDEPAPVEVLADSAYGTGRGPGRLRRCRARRDHQTVAAARGRARRVHPRRLHRRRPPPARPPAPPA